MDGKFRTSIIVDPPNGRMPEMTEAAKAKRAARDKLRGPNDGSAWWLDIDGPDGPEGREYRRRQRGLAAPAAACATAGGTAPPPQVTAEGPLPGGRFARLHRLPGEGSFPVDTRRQRAVGSRAALRGSPCCLGTV